MSNSKRLSLLALLAAAGTAQASDPGFYLGLAYSDVSADYAPPEFTAQPNGIAFAGVDTPSRITGSAVEPIGSSGLKVVLGYRVLDWLAFEADYLKLDGDSAHLDLMCITQPCPDEIHAETSSSSFSILGIWPLGRFDVFARLGLSRWESTISLRNPDDSRFWSQDVTGTDEKYGVGGQVHFHKVTGRLEYERLNFGGDAADTWSIGIAYRF